MSQEKLIVDNTSELQKLYSKGLYYIPDEYANEQSVKNDHPQQVEVQTKSVVDNEIKEVELGVKRVLNIVFEDTDFDYSAVVSNSMKSLGFEGDFEVVSLEMLNDKLKRSTNLKSQSEFLVFWGNQSKNLEVGKLPQLKLKRLNIDMPSILVSSKENKLKNWTALKTFFGQ